MKRKNQVPVAKLSLQKRFIVHLSSQLSDRIYGGDSVVIKDTRTKPAGPKPPAPTNPKPLTTSLGDTGTVASIVGQTCTIQG